MQKTHKIFVCFSILTSFSNQQPVGSTLWSNRPATAPLIGLGKKEEKCAFRNAIYGLFAAT